MITTITDYTPASFTSYGNLQLRIAIARPNVLEILGTAGPSSTLDRATEAKVNDMPSFNLFLASHSRPTRPPPILQAL